MKLREFNPENCISVSQRKGQASISIDTKVGCNRITKAACETLGLKAGDCIVFHQDETDTENWYLEKVKSGGFELRENDKITSGLLFNSVALARKIAESVDFTERSGRILIAGQPTDFQKKKLFGLITSSLRNK